MTDVFDQASTLELTMREEALARQRAEAEQRERAQMRRIVPDDGSCGDCGFQIPRARREAVPGCTRCLTCEQAADSRRKLGKR